MNADKRRFSPELVLRILLLILFAYFFLGFMLVPCLNTLTSIFNEKTGGVRDPLKVIRFFMAGSMPRFVWNSLKLAICLVITVNVVGISLVLLTEYFDIKGAKILRMGYMTTMIYSGVALVTGYMFLYAGDGMITTLLKNAFPNFNPNWFSGFNAVLFTMTFACTSNHMLFLRNAIRGIDYNTVEAARNMGANPFKVLWKVVLPTLIPTLFSLTVMTFITGLCAMSAPTLLGYDSINPEIVRLAGSTTADESFPQARAALLSIILALFTIVLLTVLSAYERKGHYLSVSKTKAKLQKQKINNPVANVIAHIYAYILFVIYMTPVVMIIVFSFQNYTAIKARRLDLHDWTLINFFGTADYTYLNDRGREKTVVGAISGVFSNEKTLGGIKLSFILSAVAAALACIIVIVACNYIFKKKGKKMSAVVEYALLFPWLLPTILICYSYRTFFNSDAVWYVGNQNLYFGQNVKLLIILAYTVVKLPFSLAHDQSLLLRHRRGAGRRGPEPGFQRAQDLPAGETAHHPAQRAGRVRPELQRPVHRVRYVGHLPEPQRHHLRHGHSGHACRRQPRSQYERTGPSMRIHGVHHDRVRPHPVPGLRRRLPGPGRTAGCQEALAGSFRQAYGQA